MQQLTAASNPFPVEAVSTYGSPNITCTALRYMDAAQNELHQYLKAHSVDGTRYGGAIGLRGIHGAGKTHLLTWLGATLRQTRTIRGTVLYAKCDSSAFSALCYQLMKGLERPLLIELIQLALLNLARRKARAAKVTESLADRLESIGALAILQAEKNIDLEQLRHELAGELGDRTGAPETVRVLLDIPDATLGADAYRWITGLGVENPAQLGVTQAPRGAGDAAGGSLESEAAAITALETIAALHQLAGVPFLILVDQLEVLLRTPDPAAYQVVSSLTKKFVEQLSRQSVLIFIAGIPEAWDRQMRDVSARFRQRDQIHVGGLSSEETTLLLGAYMKERPDLPAFGDSAERQIHQLSGGSPREILRIAHYVFEKMAGQVDQAGSDVLLSSAKSSGSLADRSRLALNVIDALLPQFGKPAQALVIDGQVVDRALLDEAGEIRLALVLVKATDSLDEIDSARRVHLIKQYAEAHWPQCDLLVITVGYASREVTRLLGEFVMPIVFDERDFEGVLRTRIVGLPSRTAAAPVTAAAPTSAPPSPSPPSISSAASAPANADLGNAVQQISQKFAAQLAELEQRRTAELARIQERFSEQVTHHAAPAVAERELRTRREMLDALEMLADALRQHNPEHEKNLVRSILVANETYLRNATLEGLGELYLEALALQRWSPDESLQVERTSLLSQMRASLKRSPLLHGWLARPVPAVLTVAGLFLLSGAAQLMGFYFEGEQAGYARTLRSVASFASIIFSIAALFVAYLCFVIALARWRRHRLAEKRLAALRDRLETPSEPHLKTRWPQSS